MGIEMSGEAYGKPKQQVIEGNNHSDEDIIEDGLRNLGNDALSLYTALNSPMPYPQDSAARWIHSFNTLSREERGTRTHDSSQSLAERRAVSREVRTPNGFEYTIHRAADGEVTLSSRTPQQ